MKFDSIPEAFQTKLRVAIMAALYHGAKDFNTLKKITLSTDGNLSVQLSRLEEQGYLMVCKEILNKKTHTIYESTKLGKNQFLEYVEMLSMAVNSEA